MSPAQILEGMFAHCFGLFTAAVVHWLFSALAVARGVNACAVKHPEPAYWWFALRGCLPLRWRCVTCERLLCSDLLQRVLIYLPSTTYYLQ